MNKNSCSDVDTVLNTIKSVLPAGHENIVLHEPCFNGNEWNYLKDCLDTGWVSSAGKYVDMFEENLAAFTGVKRAVAVVNGTAALHICLLLAGVEAGDEVLTPALTFIATTNAISYCGAVAHFVDSEECSAGMDAVSLRKYLRDIAEIKNGHCYNKLTGRRIKAVLPMHTFGHPVNLDLFVELCEEFKLVLVEDAAESIGSYYKGRHTGNTGLCSALSFNGNKIVTTGGGGAILTNDEQLGKLAKHITTTAKIPHKWAFCHDMIGYNYRMPNINAALGCAQLEQLPGFLSKKRLLAEKYNTAFSALEGMKILMEPENTISNYWLIVLLLDKKYACKRDEILSATHEQGIFTRPVWNLMYTLPMYANCPRMECKVAEDLTARIINLPSSVKLS